MKIISTSLISVALLMTGCSAKFSCGDGDITEFGCQPLTMVSNDTKGKLDDYRENESMAKVDKVAIEANEEENIAVLKSSMYKDGEPKQGYQVLEDVPIGTPILSQPRVAAIYFAPFKDEQGDLNGGGYIYMKVSDSDWVIVK